MGATPSITNYYTVKPFRCQGFYRSSGCSIIALKSGDLGVHASLGVDVISSAPLSLKSAMFLTLKFPLYVVRHRPFFPTHQWHCRQRGYARNREQKARRPGFSSSQNPVSQETPGFEVFLPGLTEVAGWQISTTAFDNCSPVITSEKEGNNDIKSKYTLLKKYNKYRKILSFCWL